MHLVATTAAVELIVAAAAEQGVGAAVAV